MPTIHAFDDELARLDAVATAEAVRQGERTAEEVVAAAVDRARRIEPELHPVACEDYDRALAIARAGRRGPFAGVPTFVKDMTDVAGLPTRNGSDAFAGAGPARRSLGIAQQMFDLGMVGLGKSTLPEFGFTPSTEFPTGPPTRNPWNTDRSVGGSSGGAAVLVATGVVPLAHGQDGGGSVRIPAACAGLVGLKPSRGRLLPDPHHRLMPVKIVTDGVLTRTVRDTAAYYQAAEVRYRSPHLPALGRVDRPLDRSLRVALLSESPVGGDIDAPTRATLEATAALLEGLGHTVHPVAPPVGEQFAEDFIHYWSLLAFLTRYGGKVLFDRRFDPGGLAPLTHGLAARCRSRLGQTGGAIRRLRASTAVVDEAMGHYDVVLSPTLAHLPPDIGVLGTHLPFDELFPRVEQWVTFTPLANATGAPAISLPLGFDDASGLPVGAMLGAPVGQDGLLLRLALQVEEAHPFRSLADATP